MKSRNLRIITSVILTLILIVTVEIKVVANWDPSGLEIGDVLALSYYELNNEDVGGQITLNGDTYWSNENQTENIFCIQNGQSLPARGTAEVKGIINIEDDGVIVNGGEKKEYKDFSDDEKREIFRMAYILDQKGGHSKVLGNEDYGYDPSEKQKAVWQNIGAFLSAVDFSMATSSGGNESGWTNSEDTINYMEKALRYVNNGSILLKRNKDVKAVKINDYNYNNAMYMKIGPFNYSYSDKIESLTLKDGNDNEIGNLKYGRYDGWNFIVSDSKDNIKSGEDFYILISKEQKIEKIGNFNISCSGGSFIVATAYLLETDENVQNIMTTTTYTKDMNNSDEMELNIDVTGSLEIQKTDLQSQSGIPNVQIQVKRNSDNKWVIGNLNGEVSYIGENEGVPYGWYKVFRTNSEGKILINGLYQGDYTVTEINNPNSAYVTRPQISKNATIEAVKTTKVKIDNQRIIDLKIVKEDTDSKTKLPNVKFKIKRTSDNKFISKSSSGGISYVDEWAATEFYTNANGEIIVNGVTAGQYIAIEIENPNKGYEKYPNTNITIEATGEGKLSRETITSTIDNKRKYIDLSGYVWEDMRKW